MARKVKREPITAANIEQARAARGREGKQRRNQLVDACTRLHVELNRTRPVQLGVVGWSAEIRNEFAATPKAGIKVQPLAYLRSNVNGNHERVLTLVIAGRATEAARRFR